jgi:hypothetical protein
MIPRMKDQLEIRTIWRTAAEHCEIVWGAFKGYHVRLWVQNRIIVDELMADADAAVKRAWELRTEWPALLDS